MSSSSNPIKQICVFCGSSPGAGLAYVQAARQLGETLARRDITVVFGGSKAGLMGQLAKAAMQAGGQVIGVIPQSLVDMEVAATGITKLHVVTTMHERKALMAELSDGFIALPGGIGTIEEFFEVLTWSQLGFHQKPCGLLNIGGYYDALLAFMDGMVAQEFIDLEHRQTMLHDATIEGLLDQFAGYVPPKGSKAAWVLERTNLIELIERTDPLA